MNLLRRARGRLGRISTLLVAASVRGRVVPLGLAVALRRLGFGPNGLLRTYPGPQADSIRDRELAECLDGVELGRWALGPASLSHLAEAVRTTRPGLIIEFGSGASTVALALEARRAGSGPAPTIISIEQEESFASGTRERLRACGLEDHVKVVVRPLVRQRIGGIDTECYAISETDLHELLGGRIAELVVIDGPVGGDTSRLGTLLLVAGHVQPGAMFLLDDALRDGELEVAARWRQNPSLQVDGILMIDKGLLVGRVRGA